jgi:elongation factor 1-gamma
MIVADIAGVSIEEVMVTKESLKEISPTGKAPFFETKDGTLFESGAMSRHIARHANKLYGSNAIEASQIDQWMIYTSGTVMQPLHKLIGFTLGGTPNNLEEYNKSMKEVKDLMKLLNGNLKGKKFLVGDSVSIADIYLAVMLRYPFQLFFEVGYRKSISDLTAWFEGVSSIDGFVRRLGKTMLCKKIVKAPTPPKEEKKEESKKEVAAAKPKEEKVEKKDDGYVSPMNLDDLKKDFANNKDRKAALKDFWKVFDPKGYSIWYLDYEMYDDEGQVLHLTINLMNGFLQRADHFRKHCMGNLVVLGDEPKLEIRGVWMWKGLEVHQDLIDHPQFEYYKSRKLDITNKADIALVEEFWTGEKVNKIQKMGIQDHKWLR